MKVNLSIFTNILNVCKNLHWITYTNSKHEALDKAYNSFYDLFDLYIETALGIYGRESALVTDIQCKLVPDDQIFSYIVDEFKQFNSSLKEITSKYAELQSIQDDIIIVEDQLCYRLKLR